MFPAFVVVFRFAGFAEPDIRLHFGHQIRGVPVIAVGAQNLIPDLGLGLIAFLLQGSSQKIGARRTQPPVFIFKRPGVENLHGAGLLMIPAAALAGTAPGGFLQQFQTAFAELHPVVPGPAPGELGRLKDAAAVVPGVPLPAADTALDRQVRVVQVEDLGALLAIRPLGKFFSATPK